jgi:acyl-CoA thioesterase
MSPRQIVEHMLSNDAFSRWLGIELVEVSEGNCVLRLQVREEMTNGFHILHGGVSYSLADSALAFAANTHGQHSLSVETSISHLRAVQPGEWLTARSSERKAGRRTGVYDIEILNEQQQCVALFRGHVFRTDKKWEQ